MEISKCQCNLCFKYIKKECERYRVNGRGKFNVRTEIQSLPFEVTNRTQYVCRICVNQLKRRSNILYQAKKIEDGFRSCQVSAQNSTQNKRPNESEDLSITPKKTRTDHASKILASTPVIHSSRFPKIQVSPIRPSTTGLNPALITEKQKTNVTIEISWPSKDQRRELPESRITWQNAGSWDL